VIDFGETYSSPNFEVRDVNGLLADAGTVTVTLTLPDLTTAAPTVSHPATGIYNYDHLTTQAGRHLAVTSATGGVLGSLIRRWTDSWIVSPADPGMGISLAVAKAHLNEQSSLQDEEIRDYTTVATAIVEGLAGPIVVRTYTDRVRQGTYALTLPRWPVISVTSVTSIRYGTVYSGADLDIDGDAGVINLANGFDFPNGPWSVVYKVGRVDPAPQLIQAIKEQLWHMWVMQRGATADSTEPDLIDVADFESRGSTFSLGFAVPRRVIEMVNNDLQPGFA